MEELTNQIELVLTVAKRVREPMAQFVTNRSHTPSSQSQLYVACSQNLIRWVCESRCPKQSGLATEYSFYYCKRVSDISRRFISRTTSRYCKSH